MNSSDRITIPIEYVGKVTYDEVINDEVIHKEITGAEILSLFCKVDNGR